MIPESDYLRVTKVPIIQYGKVLYVGEIGPRWRFEASLVISPIRRIRLRWLILLSFPFPAWSNESRVTKLAGQKRLVNIYKLTCFSSNPTYLTYLWFSRSSSSYASRRESNSESRIENLSCHGMAWLNTTSLPSAPPYDTSKMDKWLDWASAIRGVLYQVPKLGPITRRRPVTGVLKACTFKGRYKLAGDGSWGYLWLWL